jgi:hypothetical protein
MPWRFDPFLVDLVWVPPVQTITELADINFGDQSGGDLTVDAGDRTNDISDIDQGLRVFDDGNI